MLQDLQIISFIQNKHLFVSFDFEAECNLEMFL